MKNNLLYFLIVIVIVGAVVVFQQKTKDVENKKNYATVTPSVTQNGEVYKNTTLSFEITVPEGFKVENNGQYSILVLPDTEVPGQGPTNFVYISVINSDNLDNEGEVYNYNKSNYEKLDKLAVGESTNMADPRQKDMLMWFTYTRSNDYQIGGLSAKKFINEKPWEFPLGTVEERYILQKNGNIYILGSYTSNESSGMDKDVASSIISSFR